MFDDRERFVLLMLLWNFKQSADAVHSVDVPAEEAEAARAQMERINEIVKSWAVIRPSRRSGPLLCDQMYGRPGRDG
ncbi:MAG: hypothetical protein ABR540_00755 [Acidimicrobiales bacterium]